MFFIPFEAMEWAKAEVQRILEQAPLCELCGEPVLEGDVFTYHTELQRVWHRWCLEALVAERTQ